MTETIYAIYIAESAGKEMQEVSSANLVPGKGIEGDRYFTGTGTFSEQLKGKAHVELTLIQKEAVDAIDKVASYLFHPRLIRLINNARDLYTATSQVDNE